MTQGALSAKEIILRLRN